MSARGAASARRPPEHAGDVAAALERAGRFRSQAERALAGEPLSAGEGLDLLAAPDDEVAALLWAAFAVRACHFGRRVMLCLLGNARSGFCSEDCGYCSQSAVSRAAIARYGLVPAEELVARARLAARAGARRYCMVASGRVAGEKALEVFTRAAAAIRGELPGLELCVSAGFLDEAAARRLHAAGVGWVNHNLNTSRRFYPAICSTHTYAERVATLEAARAAGMKLCSGVIVGLGEDDEDLVEVALTLRELSVDSLPVNFLHPIPGTPLGTRSPVPAARALRALVLFRLANPRADVRVAGGRELVLGCWQGLALYAATSLFVEGYLTTPGSGAAQTRREMEALGFSTEVEPAG